MIHGATERFGEERLTALLEEECDAILDPETLAELLERDRGRRRRTVRRRRDRPGDRQAPAARGIPACDRDDVSASERCV